MPPANNSVYFKDILTVKIHGRHKTSNMTPILNKLQLNMFIQNTKYPLPLKNHNIFKVVFNNIV